MPQFYKIADSINMLASAKTISFNPYIVPDDRPAFESIVSGAYACHVEGHGGSRKCDCST